MRMMQTTASPCLTRSLLMGLAWVLAVSTAMGCNRERAELAGGETGSVSVVVLALSIDDVAKATVFVSGPDISPPITAPMTKTAGQWQTTIGKIPAGTGRTFTFSATDGAGAELFRGETSGITILADQSQSVSIVAQQSAAPARFSDSLPVIDAVHVSSTSVRPGQTVTLSITAHDVDPGDTLTYAWTTQAGSFSNANGPSTAWTAPGTTGPYVVAVSVQDRKQKGATANVQVIVAEGPSEPPSVPVPPWAMGLLALVLVAIIRKATIHGGKEQAR